MHTFRTWCVCNKIDFDRPSIDDVTNFMHFKFKIEKRLPRTIVGYRVAMADHYDPSIIDVMHSRVIRHLIRSYFTERPPALNKPQAWDLAVVLQALQRPPYEPMSVSTL